jgi:uncharacterized protein (DUF2147 family)
MWKKVALTGLMMVSLDARAQVRAQVTPATPAQTLQAPLQASPSQTVPTHRGQWMTEGGKSRVEVSDCGPQICAKIVWLKDPNDDKGKPLHDGYNKNTPLRNRPILGLPLFDNMRPAKAGWEGKVYNPEEGDWFDVTVWLASPDKINIKGCVLFICETHNWTRAATTGQAAAGPAAGATPGVPSGGQSAAKR